MGLPLEPETGLFPDTYVEPFIVSPEIAELADSVLAEFDEFEPIRAALREAGLVIRYVFETKPFDPAKDELKPHTIAKVTKASPLWRCLGETDLVIQFRQWFWDKFDERERRGVLHHEFMHVEVDEGGKVGLAEHDVEEFTRTVRRFGARRGHHAALFKAFLDWQHEQERPEPTPLRSVEDLAAEVATLPVAEQVVVRAALDFKRSMNDIGMNVTVADDGAIVVSEDPDALRCVGSNHIPGCEHTGGDVPKRGGEGDG